MTDVTFKDPQAVPHKYRNRFLREGGTAKKTSSTSSSSGGGGGGPVSYADRAGNADKVDGFHVEKVSALPTDPDENTIYIIVA